MKYSKYTLINVWNNIIDCVSAVIYKCTMISCRLWLQKYTISNGLIYLNLRPGVHVATQWLQQSNLSWGMSLLHQLQNWSPECIQTQSSVTQDGSKLSADNITCWWPVQCLPSTLTKNFTAIAVLYYVKSQDKSLFDHT